LCAQGQEYIRALQSRQLGNFHKPRASLAFEIGLLDKHSALKWTVILIDTETAVR